MFAAFEFRLQQFYRAANDATLQLHKTSIERDPAVHGGEQAECSFATNVCGLDSGAILQDGLQRKDGTLREMGVLEDAPASQTMAPSLSLTGSRWESIRLRLDASKAACNRLLPACSL